MGQPRSQHLQDVEFAAYTEAPSCRPTYVRRQPEKTALYRTIQENLLTFE